MEAIIRPAHLEDSRSLAELRFAFRSELAQPSEEASTFTGRCDAWMLSRLQQPSHWHCWVALVEEQFVGNVWLQRIEKIPNPIEEAELHAYLSNFYVRPKWRGKGIGGQLLDAAVEWCCAEGIDTLMLWPSQDSKPLYLRNGFVPARHILARWQWTKETNATEAHHVL